MSLRDRLLGREVASCDAIHPQLATFEGLSATDRATAMQQQPENPHKTSVFGATANATVVQQPSCVRGVLEEAKVAPVVADAVTPLHETLNPLLKPDANRKACSWRLQFKEGPLEFVVVPAMSLGDLKRDYPMLISAAVNQSCNQCLWHMRPGHTDTGYCSSPDRYDQPGPYGEGHPARFLPEDQGAACELFEGC